MCVCVCICACLRVCMHIHICNNCLTNTPHVHSAKSKPKKKTSKKPKAPKPAEPKPAEPKKAKPKAPKAKSKPRGVVVESLCVRVCVCGRCVVCVLHYMAVEMFGGVAVCSSYWLILAIMMPAQV
jgi:hypothetical protein